MKEVLNKLRKKQIDFICAECSITTEELFDMNDDTLYDVVYEKMCDIEINEEPGTYRCDTAADIVTLLGNTLD